MKWKNIFAVSITTACRDVAVKEEALQELRVQTLKYGYDIKTNVPYDGNCFFHAVWLLLSREVSDAKMLREELV